MDFEGQLQAFIAERTGDSQASISSLRRHTEGFSMETVSFEAKWKDGDGPATSRRLILRREPAAGLLEPYDLGPQVAVMRAVRSAVSVPSIPWFETDPSILGAAFYVMDFVEGDVPIPMRPEGQLAIDDKSEREAVAADFAANLVALHRFDWSESDLGGIETPAGGRAAAEAQIATWRGYYDRSRSEPLPALARAFRHMERNLPEQSPVCLVHGDYRTGNFIRKGGNITAILDWEMVHLGDPMEDLAWACSRLWRGQTDYPGLLVAKQRFLSMYEEAGGHPIDEARLAFYDLLSAVKMACIMLTGLRAFSDKRTDDTRMAIFHHQLSGVQMIVAESLGLVPSLTTWSPEDA